MRDFQKAGRLEYCSHPLQSPWSLAPSENPREAGGVLAVLWCCMQGTGGAVPRTRALAVLSTVNNVDSIRQGYISSRYLLRAVARLIIVLYPESAPSNETWWAAEVGVNISSSAESLLEIKRDQHQGRHGPHRPT
jgi:hypothetical protein